MIGGVSVYHFMPLAQLAASSSPDLHLNKNQFIETIRLVKLIIVGGIPCLPQQLAELSVFNAGVLQAWDDEISEG